MQIIVTMEHYIKDYRVYHDIHHFWKHIPLTNVSRSCPRNASIDVFFHCYVSSVVRMDCYTETRFSLFRSNNVFAFQSLMHLNYSIEILMIFIYIWKYM